MKEEGSKSGSGNHKDMKMPHEFWNFNFNPITGFRHDKSDSQRRSKTVTEFTVNR